MELTVTRNNAGAVRRGFLSGFRISADTNIPLQPGILTCHQQVSTLHSLTGTLQMSKTGKLKVVDAPEENARNHCNSWVSFWSQIRLENSD